MLKLCGGVGGVRRAPQQRRFISALYISGDKAKEQYAVLRPYMDFESTFRNLDALEYSIAKRKLNLDLPGIQQKFKKFKELSEEINSLNAERDRIAKKLQEAIKTEVLNSEDEEALREKGKELRNNLKALKDNFYPVEDDFVHDFLGLPNQLHEDCPTDGAEKLLYRSSVPPREQGASHLTHKNLIHLLDNDCYYLMNEAAEFDVDCTQAMMYYFVQKANFLPMANPDFVRCVLLEANTTAPDTYHLVKEENLQNSINSAFLTGGAAFESFLGAVAKLSVYPSVLPLRLVSCGRNYDRNKTDAQNAPEDAVNLYTSTQTNAVQMFVATATATEAKQQMEDVLNLIVDFYKALDIHFRIVYADASSITPAECLRAVIEVYSPAEQRYVAVGHLSNYSDFVSKRILFNLRHQKEYKFLHLIGGPILYTSRLIAALIENGKALNECDLLCASHERPFRKEIMKSALDDFYKTVE